MGTAIVLGTADKKRLQKNESVIDSGLKSFVEVGNALAEIRDDKLYEGFKTFEDYCSKRWSISRPRAYQLIDSAKVVDCVSTIVDITPPKNEAQARALTELKTEQQQATAWTKAVKTAPKDAEGQPKVTAAHVAKVVREMTGKKPPKAETNGHAEHQPEPPAPPVNEDSEPEDETVPIHAKGKPKVDLRKFVALEKQIGAVVRLNSALKEHCGGGEYHEQIRQHLNECLKTLATWRKKSGAA